MNENPDLAGIRAAIDDLDVRIVDLIAQRQRWVEAAGRAKARQGVDAVRAPTRVEAVVAKARARADIAGASAEVVEATYRAMIAAFIRLEMDVASHAAPPQE